MKGSTSNKGWHSGWFYLCNDDPQLSLWSSKLVKMEGYN